MASAASEDVDRLDYLNFVEHAVAAAADQVEGLDPLAMRLVITLHRATSALVYDLESSVHRPAGWSWAGFRVVFALWLGGPMEGKRVAHLAGMSRAAVSALVHTLERDGMVTKRTSARDRRAVELTITDRGAQVMRDVFAAHNERERAWASTLSAAEQRQMIRLLDKMLAGSRDAALRHRT
ncbi:MAG TPA: MarR family transcriptional regulator [Segeticoccus sp.]|uniref:MarR family winged helix-turn-helix transcriptional regulator n=1 Tax=Segeticoccus sp. TaxID=2706531 RepID=UPI002D801444|nr:MarR family transcriptional regulator [Segeticoccus sp.]HET8600182.1 MarR family transcriptional regulator [Segeticoccus sp.]